MAVARTIGSAHVVCLSTRMNTSNATDCATWITKSNSYAPAGHIRASGSVKVRT
jgi:hypothetical protein